MSASVIARPGRRPGPPKRRAAALWLAATFVALAADTTSGDEYREQAGVATSGGGFRGSATFMIHDDAVGPPAGGDSAGAAFAIPAGFVNQQVVDFSPPPSPSPTASWLRT